jgi:hypothetical protein
VLRAIAAAMILRAADENRESDLIAGAIRHRKPFDPRGAAYQVHGWLPGARGRKRSIPASVGLDLSTRSELKVFGLIYCPSHNRQGRLVSGEVIETAKNLAGDINSRFPDSQLALLARELSVLATATEERGRQAHRPFLAIRTLSALAIGLLLLGLWYLAGHIHAKWELSTFNDVLGAVNTGFNLVVLLAGALWFCATFEARIKRKETLGFIEELREFVHVVDVTQLNHTPELYRSTQRAGVGLAAIDETYLFRSTQMLGVISILAHLYTRGVTGDSVLRAASEVQTLTLAVSAKHLAKAEAVQRMKEDLAKTIKAAVA